VSTAAASRSTALSTPGAKSAIAGTPRKDGAFAAETSRADPTAAGAPAPRNGQPEGAYTDVADVTCWAASRASGSARLWVSGRAMCRWQVTYSDTTGAVAATFACARGGTAPPSQRRERPPT